MKRARTIEFFVSDTINGRQIGPESVPLGLLREFVEDVQAFLRGSDGQLNASKMEFSVKQGSFGLSSADQIPLEEPIWSDIAQLSQGHLENVDPKRAEIAQRWQKTARRHPTRVFRAGDSAGEFYLTVSDKTYFVDLSVNDWVRAERYLAGVLEESGGATPNIHLRLGNGKLLRIDATFEQLRDIESNPVYHNVTVRAEVEESVKTGDIRWARLLSLDASSPSFDEALMQRATEIGQRAWGDMDADDWIRSIRGEAN